MARGAISFFGKVVWKILCLNIYLNTAIINKESDIPF